MARVQIASTSWGVVQDKYGNAVAADPVTILTLAGAVVPVYEALTGGSTLSPATDAFGRITGYVEPGTYNVTVNGQVIQVEAVSATALGSVQAGRSTQNGTGTTTVFTIAHDLGVTPSNVNVTAGTLEASASYSVTGNATTITVTYQVAPATGVGNVVLNWTAFK